MIKKWILKAIVQKTISYLPYSHQINFLFQKHVTKGVQLSDGYFFDRLTHAREHIAAFEKHTGETLSGKKTLELGTGWYPVVPIGMFLKGADQVYTVDISNLCDRSKLLNTVERLAQSAKDGSLQPYLTPLPERLAVLQEILHQQENLPFAAILEKLHIHYLLQDARQLSFADGEIDLCHSNNTFEHVYSGVLEGLLREFYRVTKKNGGLLSHFIDMSDHFAHLDKSITIYHYLQFSDRAWHLIDNDVQPQNRLRLSEYEAMYARLGIPVTDVDFRPGDLAALATVPLSEKYRGFDTADLAVSHCLVLSKV